MMENFEKFRNFLKFVTHVHFAISQQQMEFTREKRLSHANFGNERKRRLKPGEPRLSNLVTDNIYSRK